METNLLDRMLNSYHATQTPISVTLQNKIRVSGRIRAFDSYVIVMEGQKREILYRHAISSIEPLAGEAQKRPAPAAARPAQAPRQPRPAAHMPRPSQPRPAVAATSGEQSLNTGMKEGLLRWMQENKAAK